jgi:hypothetical protein
MIVVLNKYMPGLLCHEQSSRSIDGVHSSFFKDARDADCGKQKATIQESNKCQLEKGKNKGTINSNSEISIDLNFWKNHCQNKWDHRSEQQFSQFFMKAQNSKNSFDSRQVV